LGEYVTSGAKTGKDTGAGDRRDKRLREAEEKALGIKG
jgi:hypothetical protein